jgi:hypothetical protein
MSNNAKIFSGLVGVLALTFAIAFLTRRARAKRATNCASRLDLPDGGKTLGGMTQLQVAGLAAEAKDVFDRWWSSTAASTELARRLMALTSDQLYAVQYMYDRTYDEPLVDEIENDYVTYNMDLLIDGPQSQLVKRLKTLKTGTKAQL